MKRIMVTGAGGPAGLNFIKSLVLSKEKMFIVGTDANKWHLELSDNLARRYILPNCDDPDYLLKLNSVIEKENIEFLHPQPDTEVMTISENREKIDTLTFLPSKKAIRVCQNKMEMSDILAKSDVSVPKSIQINNEKDIDYALEVLLGINPDKAWLRAIEGAGAKASLPVKESLHASVWIDYWSKLRGISYGSFMMAEYLPGNEFAWQSVWKDGELVISQARQRLEYVFGNLTPSGQTSSPAVARTVHRDDINDIATRSVLAVDRNATGVFCVDLKENIKGIPCVTEINAGRFFTTSNFFSKAGTNMPYIYVKLAYGESIPKLPKYNPVPEGWYWIRLIDGGHKLVKGEKWKSKEI